MRQFLARTARRLAIFVAGAFVVLLFLELLTRALNLAPPAGSPGWFWKYPDPEYGWQHQPNSTGRWFNPHNEYNVSVTINDKGLRDVPREYHKPADVFRILLLGDSFVEGLRVPLEQTFGKVLEAKLNGAGLPIRFEVINAGVSAWGTDQALLWYRNEGVRYEADLVLLGFFPGDDYQNNSELLESTNVGGIRKPFFRLIQNQLALAYHPFDPEKLPKTNTVRLTPRKTGDEPTNVISSKPLESWRPWLHDQSALYRFAVPILRDTVPSVARLLVSWGVIEPGQETIDSALPVDFIPDAYGVYRRPPNAEWQDAFALTNTLIRTLDRDVSASGARLGVLILTGQQQVYSELWQSTVERYPAMRNFDWDLEQPNRVVHGILDGAAIPYLDLLPIFRAQAAQNRAPLHLRHDGHWTAAGEQLAGEAIYQFLIDNQLTPTASNAPLSSAP